MKRINLLLLFVLFSLRLFSQITWMGNEYTTLSGTQYLGDNILFEIQSYPIANNQGAQVYIDWGNNGYNAVLNYDYFPLTWISQVGNNSKWNAYVKMKEVGTHNRKYLGWESGKSDYITSNFGTFTVTALSDPTTLTATTSSNTQINLSWTKWNGKNVMIVRRLTSAGASNTPVQGTAYTVGNTLGTGTVVYNGGGTNFNDTGLTPGTSYTYVFYSENYSYYSSGSTATATTTAVSAASDYFRSKATGNWNTAGTWESSDNGSSNWITATLVPGSSATAITILNGHNITLDANVSVTGLTINSGGTFTASDASPRTLTISKSASGTSTTLTNNGTWANGAGGSTVVFTGAPGSGDAIHGISGTIAFQNITINKTGGSSNVGASFGANSSVSGTLEIGNGGFISTAPPASFYGANAILKFNQGNGAIYDVNAGDYSWSTSVVPNYITISSGTVNLKSDRTATGNLLIDGGALVLDGTVNPTLTINGNWTRTSGSFTSNSGTVVLSGATNSTISLATTGTMTNLTISKTSGAKVILDGSLNTTTTILNAGSKLDINTGKTLSATTFNIKSTGANGTATLVNNGTLTATTTNVEQYLGSARNWYISSPLSAVNSPATNIARYYEYVEAGNNADLSVTGSTAYWKGYNTGHAMSAGKGYIAQATGVTTFTFTTNSGSLNNGDVTTPTLTRTNTANKPGFNLIGNPYPSYLDINSFATSPLIEATYWIRSNNSGYVFDTYNIPSALSTGLSGKKVSRYLPPMQAFWVKLKSNQTSGTLTFTNAMRAHADDTGNSFRAPALETNKIVRLEVKSNENVDEALVYFNENAANNLDAYDSQKWFNNVDSVPEIYTVADEENLAINGFNSIQLNSEIPLGFRTGLTDLQHNYKLKASQLQNIENDVELVLIDKDSAGETILNEGSEYTFTSTATNSTNRFSLVFRAKGTTTGNCCYSVTNNIFKVNINKNNQITVSYNGKLDKNAYISVLNSIGQQVLHQSVLHSATTLAPSFKCGVYILNFISQGKTYRVKVTI